MNPRILFDSLLTKGTLAATNENAAYPVSNLIDWRAGRAFAFASTSTSSTITISGLSGSPKADTFFIAGHNLSGASVTACGQGLGTVPNNKFWMKGFSEQTLGASTTVVITGAPTGFYCGIMVVGKAITIPLGAQPGWNIYGWTPYTNWSKADTGAYLGSEAFGIRREISIDYPDPGFTTAEFWQVTSPNMDTDFREHARKNPFAFGWNLDIDAEGYLCLLQSISAPFSFLSTRRTMSLSFEVFSDS